MPKEKDIYLIARYYRQPQNKRLTSIPGYINDDKNASYQESVTLSRGLKNKDVTAQIILNLTQKSVYKCNFETNNGWDELAEYFAKNYPQYMQLTKDAEPEPKEAVVTVDEDGNLEVLDGELPTEK